MTGALAPYRVLDLTTEPAWLTGRLLADLGADVIKVEPPGGDPGRRRGPFFHDEIDPENCLRWWFQNRGKRGITLDLDTEDGRSILRRLAADADVVIESFAPGWADERGIGYAALSAINPRLVYTAVTPFGQTGPYAGFQGTDLVLAATGGISYLTGDPDRPPVRISIPQFEQHGAAEAAVHTNIALYHAGATGEGQFVDVSAQLATIRTLMNATPFPELEGYDMSRQGAYSAVGSARFKTIYETSDGHVSLMVAGGTVGGLLMGQLMRFLGDNGHLTDMLGGIDWMEKDFSAFKGEEGLRETMEISEDIQDGVQHFSKEDMYQAALQYRFLLGPVYTIADIRKDIQLEAREYFAPVEQDGAGAVIEPAAWAKFGATPLQTQRRAPLIGEHTEEILSGELGLGAESLRLLSGAGVI